MPKGHDNSGKTPMIGVLAVKNLLISKAELEKGLAACSESKNPEADLKAYFLDNELISKKNIDRLARMAKALEIRRKEILFGAMAVRLGFINQSVADLALEEQEEDIRNQNRPRRIGDMLVIAGFMTQKQRDYILKLQKRERKEIAETRQEPQTEKDAASSGTQTKPLPGGLLEPEIIAGGIKLQVSGDFMAAFLTKTKNFNEDVSAGEIKDALLEKDIVFGLVSDELIQGFIDSSGFRTQSFRVARGIKPIEGKDAKIEFFFNTDYLQAGGLDAQGNIDFKQRGEIPHVETGTVLAEKTPCVEARHGQNIYGNQVATDPGNNIPLKFGKGAKLSEDGLKVLAGVTGFPKYSMSGTIYVHEEYTTEGDVDYETGHIEYDGNVNVKGSIKSGFRVSGSDIKSVEIDGGIVDAEGSLVVDGGIVEGKIFAKGGVFAKYIHKSEVICMGNVIVAREIVDSVIICSGSLIIESGKLISTEATAKMGLMVRHIGTETATPCRVCVGKDKFTEREVKRINGRIEEIKEKVQECETKKIFMIQENKDLQQEITRLAHVQDRAQLEQKEISSKIASLEGKAGLGNTVEELGREMETLEKEANDAEKALDKCFEKSERIEESQERLEKNAQILEQNLEDMKLEKANLLQWSKDNPSNPVVKVEGTIQTGTFIQGEQSDIVVKNLIRYARIMETREGDTDGLYQMQVTNL